MEVYSIRDDRRAYIRLDEDDTNKDIHNFMRDYNVLSVKFVKNRNEAHLLECTEPPHIPRRYRINNNPYLLPIHGILEFFKDSKGNFLRADNKSIHKRPLRHRFISKDTHIVFITYIAPNGEGIVQPINCNKNDWIFSATIEEINNYISVVEKRNSK